MKKTTDKPGLKLVGPNIEPNIEVAKNPGGRPKKEINWEEFDKLCFMQGTLSEIAGFFGVSEDTIENRCKKEKKMGFSEYYKKMSAGGKISLRRKQMQIAMAGNVTMLIWCGKQFLGQKDKHEYDFNDDTAIKANNNRIKTIAELLNEPVADRRIEEFTGDTIEAEAEQVI